MELPSNSQGLPTIDALSSVLHRAERLLGGHAVSALSVINSSPSENLKFFPLINMFFLSHNFRGFLVIAWFLLAGRNVCMIMVMQLCRYGI